MAENLKIKGRSVFSERTFYFVGALVSTDEFGKSFFLKGGVGKMVDCEIGGSYNSLNLAAAFRAFGKMLASEILMDFEPLAATLGGLSDMFVNIYRHTVLLYTLH